MYDALEEQQFANNIVVTLDLRTKTMITIEIEIKCFLCSFYLWEFVFVSLISLEKGAVINH